MKKLDIRCATHGWLPWKLTIVCTACGAVYQAVTEDTEPFKPVCPGAVAAPEFCTCGLRLPGKDGSAKAICTACFIQRVAN